MRQSEPDPTKQNMEMARDEEGRLLLRWRDTTGNVCLEAALEGDSLNIRRGCTTPLYGYAGP